MTVKATVSLNVKGNKLVYAGRGYQKDADIPIGEVIGEEVLSSSDKWLQVDTAKGRLKVAHGNYAEI